MLCKKDSVNVLTNKNGIRYCHTSEMYAYSEASRKVWRYRLQEVYLYSHER